MSDVPARENKQIDDDQALERIQSRTQALELERWEERANRAGATEEARKRAEARIAEIDQGLDELDAMEKELDS